MNWQMFMVVPFFMHISNFSLVVRDNLSTGVQIYLNPLVFNQKQKCQSRIPPVGDLSVCTKGQILRYFTELVEKH